MKSQMPRSSSTRKRNPIEGVEKAQVTAEAQELMKAAMSAPHFPTNFVPPMPSRPEKFPNIHLEDHTTSHQASFLQIRRPMSADLARWVVQKLEAACLQGTEEEQRAALAREVPVYSVALEFQDAYRNLGRQEPAILAKYIAAMKKAKPSRDRALKLETRVAFGPVVVAHSKGPFSAMITALPATRGKTYAEWDKTCRQVYGKTMGLSALLAPATLVYNNLERGADGIRSFLKGLAGGPTSPVQDDTQPPAVVDSSPPESTAGRTYWLGSTTTEPPTKRSRVSDAGDGVVSSASAAKASTFGWVNEEWMVEVDGSGQELYHHKSCLPPGALAKAPKLAPPTIRRKLMPPPMPKDDGFSHDLLLPGGKTLAPRPKSSEWRSSPVTV